jgi:hypothetical protein
MLLYLLTYHQVAPAFIQYLLPFGKQHHAHHFHALGLCSSSMAQPQESWPSLPQLGRSGRHIEFCYSLKAVERSPDVNSPWVVRHCSIFHHFDLETKRTAWIIIKANQVIEEAVAKYCTSSTGKRLSAQALNNALVMHRLVLEWADNNWSSYINYLTEVLLNKTNSTHLELLRPKALPRRGSYSSSSEPDQTLKRNQILSAISQPCRWILQRFTTFWFRVKKSSPSPVTDGDSLELQKVDEQQTECADERMPTSALPGVLMVGHEASQALLVLKGNSTVVTALRKEYGVLLSDDHSAEFSPEELTSVKQFCCHLVDLERDFAMHQNCVESLLREVESRKTMVRTSSFPFRCHRSHYGAGSRSFRAQKYVRHGAYDARNAYDREENEG